MTIKPKARSKTDAELRALIEAEVNLYRVENPGGFPTLAQLNERCGTSVSRLCPMAREIRDAYAAMDARVAAAPEIPEAVRAAHDQALTSFWASAQEVFGGQNDALRRELITVRTSAVDRLAETDEVLEHVEKARDAAIRRAEIAEAGAADLTAQLAAAQVEIAKLGAKVEIMTEALTSMKVATPEGPGVSPAPDSDAKKDSADTNPTPCKRAKAPRSSKGARDSGGSGAEPVTRQKGAVEAQDLPFDQVGNGRGDGSEMEQKAENSAPP